MTISNPTVYANVALEGEAENIRNSANGSRNNTLNNAAFQMARFVNDGSLAYQKVYDRLSESAIYVGLSSTEINRTISSALRSDLSYTLTSCSSGVQPMRMSSEPPKGPPLDEVKAFWDNCLSFAKTIASQSDQSQDYIKTYAQSNSYLRGRRIEPQKVAELDLARFTPDPHKFTYPTWWTKGRWRKWGIVVPLYEANGSLASVQARSSTEASPKTLCPKGCQIKELVFANPKALALMKGQGCSTREILICEGLTDFLTASSSFETIAVFGIITGSALVFSKIRYPDNAEVKIATHPDPTGESYADKIRKAIPANVKCIRKKVGDAHPMSTTSGKFYDLTEAAKLPLSCLKNIESEMPPPSVVAVEDWKRVLK